VSVKMAGTTLMLLFYVENLDFQFMVSFSSSVIITMHLASKFSMILVSLFQGAVGLDDRLFSRDSNVPSAGKSGVACHGNETNLADCPATAAVSDRCETASAVCQGKFSRIVL